MTSWPVQRHKRPETNQGQRRMSRRVIPEPLLHLLEGARVITPRCASCHDYGRKRVWASGRWASTLRAYGNAQNQGLLQFLFRESERCCNNLELWCEAGGCD